MRARFICTNCGHIFDRRPKKLSSCFFCDGPVKKLQSVLELKRAAIAKKELEELEKQDATRNRI